MEKTFNLLNQTESCSILIYVRVVQWLVRLPSKQDTRVRFPLRALIIDWRYTRLKNGNNWIYVASIEDLPEETTYINVITKTGTILAGLWHTELGGSFLPHGKFHISWNDIYAYSKFDIPEDVLKSMYSNLAWNQKGVFSKNYIILRYLEAKGITL